jgi:glucose/arabinose dehydrogenase
VTAYEVFADNFMLGSNATYNRRPVDLLVLPDGLLLVSDDQSHQIYRI